MDHELKPSPEHMYSKYLRAEERLRTMQQARRELPNFAFEDVQEIAAQRNKAIEREVQRIGEILVQAEEYTVNNLPELKKQAIKEARSWPHHKTINPI